MSRVPSRPMDRRSFLTALGATALGTTAFGACAQPERDLLSGTDVDAIELGPRPDDQIPTSTVADEGTTIAPTTSAPYPADVPEEDYAGISFIAFSRIGAAAVYATPEATTPSWTFDDPIASGGPLVFLIDELTVEDRQRVLLPVRPNGSFGWIDTDAIDIEWHNYAIVVELSDFRFTLFDHGEPAFTTVVGVARDNAPTPDGIYYTTELLRPPTPDSAYGTYAYGLSGYSETFEEFAGGPGQLGIHGTNDPATLGTPVSSGCIRMSNDDISFLVESIGLPVGVPVEVRA